MTSGIEDSTCCRWLSSHLQKPLPGATQAGAVQNSNGKEKASQVAALVSFLDLRSHDNVTSTAVQDMQVATSPSNVHPKHDEVLMS